MARGSSSVQVFKRRLSTVGNAFKGASNQIAENYPSVKRSGQKTGQAIRKLIEKIDATATHPKLKKNK